MKILFLDQFSEMGGAQRALLDTTAAVRERDWEAWVALPGAGPLVDRLRTLGVTVVEVPCGPYQSGSKNLGDLFRLASDFRHQTRILSDLASHVSFDLIHVNGPRLLPAASALAQRRAIPLLFQAHSHIPQRAARHFAARSIRRANASVVACSASVLDSFRGCADPSKVQVIANGTPALPFQDRRFAGSGRWRVGVIGRISPEKGQADFVHAAKLLQHELPDAEFVICGAPLFADPAYFKMVQNLAHGARVQFLGWTDDVASVLADLDLLVAPSRQEGMGRIILEAFSAGVPVVAYATGGIPEIVIDGETGFLTTAKSAEALAQRIREVIATDPAKLRCIVTRARDCWQQGHTLVIYQKRITDWMERLVSPEGAALETTMLQTRT